MHDLIIRNGTIIDGSGADAFDGDVAVRDRRIVEVGDVTGKASREIDARGALVTPGWVDIHTHYDGQATWDPLLAPSSWHGVTTVVMGNCGVGFAPVRPGQREFLIELMEGVEDIPGTALAEGIDWRWESFPEYLDALATKPRAIDVGAQVPHGAVRAYVMGARCNTENDLPTETELAEMARIVREGIAAGALGFSSSRTFLHRDKHGIHVPGTFAGSDEMLALGMSMKGLGHGVFELVSDHLGGDDEWDWVRRFTRETGRPVTLVATSAAAFADGRMLRIAEQSRAEGIEVRPQVAGRPTGVLHGLQSSFHVFSRLPSFAPLAALPLSEKVARLGDPALRAVLLEEACEAGPTLMAGSLEELLWFVFPLGERPDYEPDREDSIAGRAQAAGRAPLRAMYDALLEDGGRELFYQPLGFYQSYDFGYFHETLQHPNVLFGLSDGGAHCGLIADAGMPSFILAHWGRDRTKGDKLPLPFLVRKLSHDTASAYGIADRGLLEPGYLADLNVIDFERLQLHRPEALHDLPTGGKRLIQRVEGYQYIVKSGAVTFEAGEHTGALPGQLIRGGH